MGKFRVYLEIDVKSGLRMMNIWKSLLNRYDFEKFGSKKVNELNTRETKYQITESNAAGSN